MDRRQFIQAGGAVALSCSSISTAFGQDKTPIKVGVLQSLSGTMAISETALKETALMTIADINSKGGVMGRQIEPVVPHATQSLKRDGQRACSGQGRPEQ